VLWGDALESVVLDTAEDLAALLETFRPEPVSQHVALMPPEALRSYLLMTVVRVVRVVEALRRRGFKSGRVLDVGAWFGSFALALRRLGYDVVACDRYASYGHAFDGYVDLLEQDCVKVVATTRSHELDEIRGLGTFDAVVAAAVIEHVPHTPRQFLRAIFERVRPGGLLLLDTPNLTRYWNRRRLEGGETIFQPLADQYDCEPPWEGHHREYTASELAWMLDRVGCVDVEVEFLDYNMLQFEELSAEHIECLATIIEDPSQSDIILGVGRRPVEGTVSEVRRI
jgi:SAM-dependent methyltransferase